MSSDNPWKYAKQRDVTNNPYAMAKVNDKSTDSNDSSLPASDRIYSMMSGVDNYAKAVRLLWKHFEKCPSSVHPQFTLFGGSEVYRPLTFKETIEARVDDYNTEKNRDGSTKTSEQRLRLFNTRLDTCTGIVYEKHDAKKSFNYKIIPVCSELININPIFLPVEYSDMSGIELNSSVGLYNQKLSMSQILEHRAWLEVLEDDKALLKNYSEIIFNFLKDFDMDQGMEFELKDDHPDKDQLREVYTWLMDVDSDSYDNVGLTDDTSFLLTHTIKDKEKYAGGSA